MAVDPTIAFKTNFFPGEYTNYTQMLLKQQ